MNAEDEAIQHWMKTGMYLYKGEEYPVAPKVLIIKPVTGRIELLGGYNRESLILIERVPDHVLWMAVGAASTMVIKIKHEVYRGEVPATSGTLSGEITKEPVFIKIWEQRGRSKGVIDILNNDGTIALRLQELTDEMVDNIFIGRYVNIILGMSGRTDRTPLERVDQPVEAIGSLVWYQKKNGDVFAEDVSSTTPRGESQLVISVEKVQPSVRTLPSRIELKSQTTNDKGKTVNTPMDAINHKKIADMVKKLPTEIKLDRVKRIIITDKRITRYGYPEAGYSAEWIDSEGIMKLSIHFTYEDFVHELVHANHQEMNEQQVEELGRILAAQSEAARPKDKSLSFYSPYRYLWKVFDPYGKIIAQGDELHVTNATYKAAATWLEV